MIRISKVGIFILVLMVSFWNCNTLRCQLDDGPSEEELKKVVRTCMRKLGDGSSDRSDSEDSYEDNSSDDERFEHNKKYNKSNSSRGTRFARDVNRWQVQQYGGGYDNSYGNKNQQRYDNGYGSQHGYSNNYENNRNHNLSSNNRNRNDNDSGGDDKSCMIQCFFQEMKMTNSEGFPDKHKVERSITQDVRDREMRSFLLDSIRECFHIVEMERRRDKCVFSKNIVSCLAERAKANCDDYYNETMIF